MAAPGGPPLSGTGPAVQKGLDAVVEHLLLLNGVFGHPGECGEGTPAEVFTNARLCKRHHREDGRYTPARMNPMNMLPVAYGYARVSKSDDDAKNLDTQLRLLAHHGIREDLIFTDVASGRTMNRPGWRDLMGRVQPGDTISRRVPGPVQPQL